MSLYCSHSVTFYSRVESLLTASNERLRNSTSFHLLTETIYYLLFLFTIYYAAEEMFLFLVAIFVFLFYRLAGNEANNNKAFQRGLGRL